jgi:hypothetical protein
LQSVLRWRPYFLADFLDIKQARSTRQAAIDP